MAYKMGIITVSDKGAAGEREDQSGVAIREAMQAYACETTEYRIVPDERELIALTIRYMADVCKTDLILTTGGTGLSPRDVTPEATLDVIERTVPGIPEAMRAASLAVTNRAMLTRGIAGTRGKTLIINLPGSPKAVRECIAVFGPALGHALDTLKGEVQNCAR